MKSGDLNFLETSGLLQACNGTASPSTTVNLASTNNALPDDGVTAPKHVGAVLMKILILFLR